MHHAVARARPPVSDLNLPGAESPPPTADNRSLRTRRLAPRIHLVECVHGVSGNVAVLTGRDGLLIVDSMFAASAASLRNALRVISPLPVRWVISTHSHLDHTGGNELFRENATVLAHQNTHQRLRETEGAELYPMQIFAREQSLWFGGETIHVQHLPASHTDGDAIVYFEGSGVLHLGDIFFRGMFPVSRESGGTLRGLTRALERVVADYPPDTIVIPGHGDATTMPAVAAHVSALRALINAMDQARHDGRTSSEFEQDPKMQTLARGLVTNDAHAADYLDGLWELTT